MNVYLVIWYETNGEASAVKGVFATQELAVAYVNALPRNDRKDHVVFEIEVQGAKA